MVLLQISLQRNVGTFGKGSETGAPVSKNSALLSGLYERLLIGDSSIFAAEAQTQQGDHYIIFLHTLAGYLAQIPRMAAVHLAYLEHPGLPEIFPVLMRCY